MYVAKDYCSTKYIILIPKIHIDVLCYSVVPDKLVLFLCYFALLSFFEN